MIKSQSRLPDIIAAHDGDMISQWVADLNAMSSRQGVIKDAELLGQASDFLRLFADALRNSSASDIHAREWDELRELLCGVSRSRALQGFTSSETAGFVLSLKRTLYARLKIEITDTQLLGEEFWRSTEILDKLGLFTMEAYQKAREEVIARQQQELLELSTPVVTH